MPPPYLGRLENTIKENPYESGLCRTATGCLKRGGRPRRMRRLGNGRDASDFPVELIQAERFLDETATAAFHNLHGLAVQAVAAREQHDHIRPDGLEAI